MTGADTDEIHIKAGWSFRFVVVTCVAYLIIPAMGYTLVCLNAPGEIIKEFMNQTEMERTGQSLHRSQIDSLYGLLVAVIGLGAAVGSLTSDAISGLIGRKYALFVACVTGCVGTLMMALCTTGRSYEMLFVGRTVNGLALGWGFSLAPPYIMDMCQSHQKGAAAVANMISQSVAILVAQVCGYEELLGNHEYWLYLIGLPLVLLVVQLILLPFCPQNPRYLLMNRNDEAGAIKALQLIRGRIDVTNDIKQIRMEMADSATAKQMSVFKLISTPIMRRPLLTAMVMGLQLNWCGINGILLFSGLLFKEMGVTGPSSRYASSGTGAIFLLSNTIGAFLLTRFGRKTIYGVGMGSVGVWCAVFALTTVFQKQVEFLKYVNVVVALCIVATFAIGPVCVFWVILGELFPHSARGSGFGVAVLCAFSGFFTHCYALPVMIEAMSSYTFFVFAGIDAGIVILCIFYMPETKNKTFEEISESWTKQKHVDNELKSSNNLDYIENVSNGKIERQVETDYNERVQKEYKGSNDFKDGDTIRDFVSRL